MTLENELKKNTEALNALTQTLLKQGGVQLAGSAGNVAPTPLPTAPPPMPGLVPGLDASTNATTPGFPAVPGAVPGMPFAPTPTVPGVGIPAAPTAPVQGQVLPFPTGAPAVAAPPSVPTPAPAPAASGIDFNAVTAATLARFQQLGDGGAQVLQKKLGEFGVQLRPGEQLLKITDLNPEYVPQWMQLLQQPVIQ